MAVNPFYNPETFLLDHDLEKELFQQAVELINYVNGNSTVSDDRYVYLKQMYLDILFKYKDVQQISYQAAVDRIKEAGYDYLLSLFTLTEQNLKVLVSYLPMIQQMKGSRPGLQLIFDILNIGFVITEWWEDPNNLDILSYILSVEIINQEVNTRVVSNLHALSRNYVYPLLTKIVYGVLYKLNPTPYIGVATQSRSSLEIRQDVNWLVWDDDSDPNQLWSDTENPTAWNASDSPEMVWASGTDEQTSENSWSEEGDKKVWKNQEAEAILLNWWESLDTSSIEDHYKNWSGEIPTYWS
jgi:hypothetical protein